jgi:hypothetical protein
MDDPRVIYLPRLWTQVPTGALDKFDVLDTTLGGKEA